MTKSTTTTVAPVLATVAEYLAADAKGKAAIRKAAEEAMRAAIVAQDTEAAMAAMQARDGYVSARAAKAPVEVNWDELVAGRIATLEAAIYRLRTGAFDGAPEGYRFEGDATKAPVDEAAMATLTKVRRASRRDLGAAIADVVTGDFMTVAAIRRAITEATEGDYVPSDGAIAARLFAEGGCTVPGVVAVEATTEAPRGARRA